jgi:hypothetical protein
MAQVVQPHVIHGGEGPGTRHTTAHSLDDGRQLLLYGY